METYTHDGYTLTLEYKGLRTTDHRSKVGYTLTKEGETDPIFSGEDFSPSPCYEPEGPKSAAALLCFLTLREGDTDPEYFEDYTPRQTEFSECEAEDLQWWGYSLCCPQCDTEYPPEFDGQWEGPGYCDFCGTERG